MRVYGVCKKHVQSPQVGGRVDDMEGVDTGNWGLQCCTLKLLCTEYKLADGEGGIEEGLGEGWA
jgi:hypothetical protein